MTANPLKSAARKEKSPTDPQECCDWANERMNPELAAYGVRWVVTGNKDQPIALSDRCAPRLVAPADTRRMAETGNTDSVRSTGSAVPKAGAQTS